MQFQYVGSSSVAFIIPKNVKKGFDGVNSRNRNKCLFKIYSETIRNRF